MTSLRSSILMLLVVIITACAAETGDTPSRNVIASAQQGLGVTGGDVPLPSKTVAGIATMSWNGSYAELLAADALAMCWTTQAERSWDGGTTDSDNFLRGLASKMSAATCRTTCSNPAFTSAPDILFCSWLDGRKDRLCNVDAATGVPKALDTSKLRAVSQTAAYQLPPVSGGTVNLGLSGSQANLVRTFAQQEVAYADLSLCMAQQLRQQLDTVQVAFAPTGDLESVLEMVRERSLTATYQYSVIGKALAASGTPGPLAINDSAYWVAPLTQWGRLSGVPASTWELIGQDFAQSIALLTEATEKAIELKLRQPAAQDSFGKFISLLSYLSLTGPRADVLNQILYDYPASARRAVSTDMSDPKVALLIGLARRANALRLPFNNASIDRFGCEWGLRMNVENFLRQEECTRDSVTPCPLVGLSTPESEFVIRKRFGIEYQHSYAVCDALTNAILGPPIATSGTGFGGFGDFWQYGNLFFTHPAGPLGPAQQLTFHLLGNHQFVGTTATSTGEIIVDKNFEVTALRAHDLQSQVLPAATPPVMNMSPYGTATAQGFAFRSRWFGILNESTKRNIGSNTTLALARETLLQLGALADTLGPKKIYVKAEPAIDMIEGAIGTRQVMVRQALTSTANAAACTGCVRFNPGSSTAGAATLYNLAVDVLAKSDDPYRDVSVDQGVAHAATAALSPSFASIWGTSQANLAAPARPYSPLVIIPQPRGYEQRRINGVTRDSTWPHGATVMLRGGTSGDFTYNHVFTGMIGFASSLDVAAPGLAVTFGGRFGRLAEQAWAFEQGNWSAPKFDAFGLPKDWAPAADASLQAGGENVPIEEHLLNRASTAAAEATVALQQAFETLQQEAVDDTALANSELRSQSLTTLEMKSICGAAPTCVDSTADLAVGALVPDCPVGASPFCATARTALLRIMGSGPGTTGKSFSFAWPVVISVLQGHTSAIDQYKGGRLHGLFLQQYTAILTVWKELERAIATAESTSAQISAATAEENAALAEHNQVKAEIDAAYAQLEGQVAGLTAQKQIYLANEATYQTQLNTALIEKVRQCSEQAFQDAEAAGWSYSGQFVTVTDTVIWSEQESWSNGPKLAQVARCNDATANYNLTQGSLTKQRVAMQEMADALQVQIDAFNLQYVALPKRLAASWVRTVAAWLRTGAVKKEQATQMATAYLTVQSAFNQVLLAGSAINQAFAEVWLIWGRNKVEETLQGYDIRTRFGVRKRFRSYDLWRARALSENARRLAIAARRAIESRYVVNLSKLSAPESFVAAPALWSDEIYSSDLKPPVALGLEKSPSTSSGIYTNKLVDYVNNLKLFVDGYAVSRPTAVVRSDAEVIQLPGPAAQVRGTSFDASFTLIDPESTGWSFYCEATNTWIPHPNLTSFTEATPEWDLSTACDEKPPTLARIGFSLDPWGRIRGNVFEPPFEDRHNVRWGDLAVNLVGTGIRDCTKAVDPNACYAEPFIRYDLEHVGPVWVTDFEQSWRSLDIPTAVVEGGKALAAEEWLDPVTNGFNRPDVHNVQRMELRSRPLGGMYSLTLRLSPEIRVERIERIQLLLETKYWVRQR